MSSILDKMQASFGDMQQHMKQTFDKLSSAQLEGFSEDRTVKVIMTATYEYVDMELTEKALFGGLDKLKQRIAEAMRDVTQRVKDATQSQTASLLENVELPEELRNLQQQTKPAVIEHNEEGGSAAAS